MIGIIIAFLGSFLAGIWDLFTTEVPDDVPYLMVFFSVVFHFLAASATGNFIPLFFSLVIGTLLLVIGLIFYHFRQWGGADAWILAAIGYALPFYNGKLFIIDYIPTFFIVAAAYTIAYALALGFLNRFVFKEFMKSARNNLKLLLPLPIIFLMILIFSFFDASYSRMLFLLALASLMMPFWLYGRIIEKQVFRKKIPVSKLKVGDVIEDMKWIGLTAEEIKDISKKKKYVIVKEGIRFVPAFPIALAVTLIYGNLLYMVIL